MGMIKVETWEDTRERGCSAVLARAWVEGGEGVLGDMYEYEIDYSENFEADARRRALEGLKRNLEFLASAGPVAAELLKEGPWE